MTLVDTSPDVLTTRFSATRALTEQLAGLLSAEDQTAQSMPDASPTRWHRAHTTWFFEEFVLADRCPPYRTIRPFATCSTATTRPSARAIPDRSAGW